MIKFKNKGKTVSVTLAKMLKYSYANPVASVYTAGRSAYVGSRCVASCIYENIDFETIEVVMKKKEIINIDNISKYIPKKYDLINDYKIIAWSSVKL